MSGTPKPSIQCCQIACIDNAVTIVQEQFNDGAIRLCIPGCIDTPPITHVITRKNTHLSSEFSRYHLTVLWNHSQKTAWRGHSFFCFRMYANDTYEDFYTEESGAAFSESYKSALPRRRESSPRRQIFADPVNNSYEYIHPYAAILP